MNRKPPTTRRTLQMLVIVTLLAWATQTMVSQWGFGNSLPRRTPIIRIYWTR
jgi:hypothetical protein